MAVLSDSVHLLEDGFLLALDLYSELLAHMLQLAGHCGKVLCACSRVGYHHHVEVALNDGLTDVEDVYLAFC